MKKIDFNYSLDRLPEAILALPEGDTKQKLLENIKQGSVFALVIEIIMNKTDKF